MAKKVLQTPESSPDRPVCRRCRRPAVACWCADLPSVPTRTRVVFLQHPREVRVAIGTARMAHLCLPNSELHVGIDWDDVPALQAALSDPLRPPVLLFPGPDAPDILRTPPEGPVTLVVLDGTWSQAAKLVHRNPRLAALPRYAFRPPAASEYRIRREPHEDCVSTIEALSYVLGVLEDDPAGALRLLAPFRSMVEFQVQHAEQFHSPRRRIRNTQPPPPPPALATLVERAPNLVCVAGEANAWPRKDATGIADELIHWVAVRPATGETFQAVLAPRHAMAPSAHLHAEIPATDILGGESFDAFRARWTAFLQPDDVLLSWGCHYTGMLLDEGGPLPLERIDIRQFLRDLSKRHVGSLEVWHEGHVGTPAPRIGRGRAGLRLGLLADVVARSIAGSITAVG